MESNKRKRVDSEEGAPGHSKEKKLKASDKEEKTNDSTSDLDRFEAPHSHCNYVHKQIILGAVPLEKHVEKIGKLCKVFVSLMEYHPEYEGKLPEGHLHWHCDTKRGGVPNLNWIKTKANELVKMIQADPSLIIYVHCVGGYARSVIFTCYLLHQLLGWSGDQCLEHIRARVKQRQFYKRRILVPENKKQEQAIVRLCSEKQPKPEEKKKEEENKEGIKCILCSKETSERAHYCFSCLQDLRGYKCL